MKCLLISTTMAAIAIAPSVSADTDPRLGTKACVVENARAFDPYAGKAALWDGAQRSFVLNVYTCEDVRRDKINLGYDDACPKNSGDWLAIKTTIEGAERGWGGAASAVMIDGKRTPLIAEFVSSIFELSVGNGPLFRLYPDQKFEFFKLSASTGTSKVAMFSMTGTCADFQ